LPLTVGAIKEALIPEARQTMDSSPQLECLVSSRKIPRVNWRDLEGVRPGKDFHKGSKKSTTISTFIWLHYLQVKNVPIV